MKEVEIILLYAYYATNFNLINNETLFINFFITRVALYLLN